MGEKMAHCQQHSLEPYDNIPEYYVPDWLVIDRRYIRDPKPPRTQWDHELINEEIHKFMTENKIIRSKLVEQYGLDKGVIRRIEHSFPGDILGIKKLRTLLNVYVLFGDLVSCEIFTKASRRDREAFKLFEVLADRIGVKAAAEEFLAKGYGK
jgi:hypothetical protein